MSHVPDPLDGPWLDEPDFLSFTHGGFLCQISRNQQGSLCGYVALPLTHPCAGLGSDAVPVSVHGGWTYAEDHFPRKRSKTQWIIGFDCGHADDLNPYAPVAVRFVLERLAEVRGVKLRYWTIDDVRAELVEACNELAMLQASVKKDTTP